MWNISAEPMPSRISTPVRSFHSSVELRRQGLAGREAHAQGRGRSAVSMRGECSMLPIRVGTLVRNVGR